MNVRDWEAQAWALYPGRRSESTTRHHRQMCAPFVRAYGDRELAAVDRIAAQRWALRHPSQVTFLRRLFALAMRAGLVDENVWTYVEVERPSAPRLPPPAPKLDAIVAECTARGGWWAEVFGPMIVTAAYTGARLGGLVELWPRDVDLVAGRMVVTEKGSKTRTVALLGPSYEAVRERMGVAYGRLFVSQQGRPMTRERVGECWRDVAAEVGWRGPFHGLRAFCASWLKDQGASDEDIAVQLGHFDDQGRPYPDLVRRVYSRPDHSLVLQRLDRLVSGSTGSTGPADTTEGSHGVGGARAA